jgi:4-hydroxy 2-oxovalerate aldolase
MKARVLISDPTLRDGNHAIAHQLSVQQIEAYAATAERARIDIIEVGHGNGLGASSSLLGHARESDADMLEAARKHCRNTKLGIHFIPGFGKNQDLDRAIEIGVDVFRIASHCTEANTTRRYIEKVKSRGLIAYGVLMMAHMADGRMLCAQAALMKRYGADAIILMDSAGASTPKIVQEKVDRLLTEVGIRVGYHAHNNLGLAVANSIVAIESGATIIDGCSKGFGAGAGNTQLETLVAVLELLGYSINTNFKRVVELVRVTEELITNSNPNITCSHIASGLYGLFSGYVPHIERIAKSLGVDQFDLCERLAARKLVAGQEDIILEEAHQLAKLTVRKETANGAAVECLQG